MAEPVCSIFEGSNSAFSPSMALKNLKKNHDRVRTVARQQLRDKVKFCVVVTYCYHFSLRQDDKEIDSLRKEQSASPFLAMLFSIIWLEKLFEYFREDLLSISFLCGNERY